MNQDHLSFHPGEILFEVYMKDLHLDPDQLAKLCRCSPDEINSIVNGKKDISVQLALVLGRVLNTGAEVWLRMQQEYDQQHGR